MSDPNQPESSPPEGVDATAEVSAEATASTDTSTDTPTDTPTDIKEASGTSNGGSRPRAPKSLPIRQLATVRIAYPRQFDTLRAFVIAWSQAGNQPVTLGEVSPHASLSVNTLSMITNFFVAANLLTKSDGNRYAPTDAAVEFERSYHWNKETAPHALMGALENTWFGQAVINRLKMRGTMTVQEATELLAAEAQALPEYRPQIKLNLEWLITTGVLDRDGANIKIARKVHAKAPGAQPTPTPKQDAEKHGDGAASGARGAQADESGAITLNVAIKIDVKELMTMTPDRISAFFQGLAAVVAAKGGLES